MKRKIVIGGRHLFVTCLKALIRVLPPDRVAEGKPSLRAKLHQIASVGRGTGTVSTRVSLTLMERRCFIAPCAYIQFSFSAMYLTFSTYSNLNIHNLKIRELALSQRMYKWLIRLCVLDSIYLVLGQTIVKGFVLLNPGFSRSSVRWV